MIFAVGLFWLAYATVNVAFKDQLIALKERKSQYVRITYEDRLAAMRETFIANASHERKTPRASIIGFIETLQGPAKNDAITNASMR